MNEAIKIIKDKITFLEKYDTIEGFKIRILVLKDILKEIEKL
jgi:hypothetical protein